MEDKTEMIQNFGDMVNATERLAKPWQEECERWKQIAEKKQKHITAQLIVSNLFWAVVVCLLVWFAYMAPETSYQSQDFEGKAQTQSVGTEVVTDGR